LNLFFPGVSRNPRTFLFGKNRGSMNRIYIILKGLPVDDVIDRILYGAKTVAVVGLSDKPHRPSHGVAQHLQESGYRVIPVNPMIREALGEKSYGSLTEIPGEVDLVDVFRRSENVPGIAEEAIRIGAKYFWMQEGVVSERARARLAAAGIPVVMDRCVSKELAKRGR